MKNRLKKLEAAFAFDFGRASLPADILPDLDAPVARDVCERLHVCYGDRTSPVDYSLTRGDIEAAVQRVYGSAPADVAAALS
jgi:hypothetical protein